MKRLMLSLVAVLFVGLVAAPAGARGPDRSKPPLPKPPAPWKPDAPRDFTLDNGLKVRFVERHAVPLLDVVVQIGAGAAADPLGLEGTASWTLDLLDEGAGARDALGLAGAIDLLGASLSTSAEWSRSDVSLRVPSERADDALGILADVLLRPTFAETEWQKKKKEAETRFLQWREDPWALFSLARERALFGKHRYGLPRSGTPASLAQVKLKDLKAWWARYAAPDNATIFVVGDTTEAELRVLLQKHLGKWRRAAPGGHTPLPKPARIEGREIVLVDKPGAPQTILAMTARAPDALDPLAADTDVMNTLLGGSFTSRLNQNLREENQYSYGARSVFQRLPAASRMFAYAAVATPVTAPAAKEMFGELVRIRSYVEDTEAERARRYLALTFPSSFETGGAVAGYWAWAAAQDKTDAEVQSYTARVLDVGHRQTLEAALRDVDTRNLRVVVVGDAAVIEPELKKLELGPIRRLPIEELVDPK